MPANMRADSTGRFQNPAPPRPSFRPLHQGHAVQVYDWRCPGCDTPGDRGELNDAYEIVVVRSGSFVRQVNGVPAFLAAGMLTFAAPGEVHRIRHPVGRPTMFYCGNDPAARAETARILDQLGWEGADMGSAVAARAIEPLAVLWCIPGFREDRWTHAFKLLTR